MPAPYEVRCPGPHPHVAKIDRFRGRLCDAFLTAFPFAVRWTERFLATGERARAGCFPLKCDKCFRSSEWMVVAPESAELTVVHLHLTEDQRSILGVMARTQWVSGPDLRRQLVPARPERSVRADIRILVSAGLIEKMGSTKRARWRLRPPVAGILPNLPNSAESMIHNDLARSAPPMRSP